MHPQTYQRHIQVEHHSIRANYAGFESTAYHTLMFVVIYLLFKTGKITITNKSKHAKSIHVIPTYKTVWFVGPFTSGLTYYSLLPTDFVSIATCVCGIRSYQRSM